MIEVVEEVVVVVNDAVVVVEEIVVVDVVLAVVCLGLAFIWTTFLRSCTKASLVTSQVTSMTSPARPAVRLRLEMTSPSSSQVGTGRLFLPWYLGIHNIDRLSDYQLRVVSK